MPVQIPCFAPTMKPENPSRLGLLSARVTKIIVETNLVRYSNGASHQPAETRSSTIVDAETKKEVTREKFANFLAWLSPDCDSAGEEYERLRFRLCTFFSSRKCSYSDELADETINRVIVKVSEERIESKLAYCYAVAKNVYRESLRKQRPHVDIDNVIIVAKEPEEPAFSSDCLDECLQKLPAENRNLLLEYFSEAKRTKIELHQRISESLKTSQTALRMRVMRSKQKLKVCVQECMG